MARHRSKESYYRQVLLDIIGDDYIDFIFNIEYSKSGLSIAETKKVPNPIGECDVLAQRIDFLYDLYEIKSTKSGLSKARFQLTRAKNLLDFIVDTYIYIGNENKIINYR